MAFGCCTRPPVQLALAAMNPLDPKVVSPMHVLAGLALATVLGSVVVARYSCTATGLLAGAVVPKALL